MSVNKLRGVGVDFRLLLYKGNDRLTRKSEHNVIPCKQIRKGYKIKLFYSRLSFRANEL